MLLIQKKIGYLKDFQRDARTIDWIEMEWFESSKRIQTKKTVQGMDVQLKFLNANPRYTEGEVLFENESTIIAVHILPCNVIVIKPRNTFEIASVCYEIGNKHQPLFMDGNDFLIPFEMPLFGILNALNYIVLKEKRQLLHQLKTTVSPHVDISEQALLSKPADVKDNKES